MIIGMNIMILFIISFLYLYFQALKGVTATIAEQEVVVVLGPSGSGKSTWIRCINRLEAHQKGTIVVDGVELTKYYYG